MNWKKKKLKIFQDFFFWFFNQKEKQNGEKKIFFFDFPIFFQFVVE